MSTPSLSPRPTRAALGIGLHLAGLATLSSLDATGKLLVAVGVPVLWLSWVRYGLHVVLMSTLVLPRRGKRLFATRSLALQLARGVAMLCTTLLFFSVLRIAPLAEGTAMNFVAPLIVMALAPWLLGEPHRLHRWVGVCAGFVGMLLVVRPGGALSTTAVMLGMATAATFAVYQISNRLVAHDDPLTSNFYGGLVGTAGLTLALPFAPPLPPLDTGQWLLLASTGLTGFLGHWLQITAYREAPATLLAPFSYAQIVVAALLGWAVFGQLPDATTALGIAVICAAGLGVALYERNRSS